MVSKNNKVLDVLEVGSQRKPIWYKSSEENQLFLKVWMSSILLN